MRRTTRPVVVVLLSLLPTGACTGLQEGSDPNVQRRPTATPPAPDPAPEPVAPDARPEPIIAPDAAADADLEPGSPPPDARLPTDSAPDAASPCPTASAGTYGQICGACGGTVTCSGACTVPTPSDYGQITIGAIETLQRTGGQSPESGEWIGRDCARGHAGAGCSVIATHNGSAGAAACSVAREGRTCRCRVRWRADPGVTLRCTVTILARRTCDP